MASLLDQFKAKWIDSVSEAMTPEQYAAKKKMMAAQPHLFDSHAGQENLGVGRWITIGAEKDEDGEHHGGHHVFIGNDGKMKTGKFAGQTMDEAFGKQAKPQEQKQTYKKGDRVKVTDKNSSYFGKEGMFVSYRDGMAKVILPTTDRLGRPGETDWHFDESQLEPLAKQQEPQPGQRLIEGAQKAFEQAASPQPKPDYESRLEAMQQRKDPDGISSAIDKMQEGAKASGIQQPPTAPGDQLGLFGDTFKAPAKKPVFEPTLSTGGKQQGLFDTSGNADQMQLFGDAATPEDLVYKPEDSQKKSDDVADEAKPDKPFDAKAAIDEMRASGKSLVSFAKEKNLTQEQRKAAFEEFARQNEEARQPKPPSEARARAMEKAKANQFEPTLADKPQAENLDPIPLRDRKSVAAQLASDGKQHSDIVDHFAKRGVALVDARKLAADALGDLADKKSVEPKATEAAKPLHDMTQEELSSHIASQKGNSLVGVTEEDWGNSMRGQGKRVKGMVRGAMSSPPQGKKTYTNITGKLEGKEREETALLEEHEKLAYARAREAGIPHEHALTWAWEAHGDPDFAGLTLKGLKEDAAKAKGQLKPDTTSEPAPQPESKPAEPPKEAVTPTAKATNVHDSTLQSGGTPREAAKAAQKELDADYAFARASSVRNAGEDLKGSARHRVNEWKSLEDAEKNGTAEAMVKRDELMKHEPHDLMSHAHKNPATSLAMHFAMRSFPAKPGTTNKSKAASDREEYLQAYRDVKKKAEELAQKHEDPEKAIKELQLHVRSMIDTKRTGDRYNATANDLVGLHNALKTGYFATKTGPAARTQEFLDSVKAKYGEDWDKNESIADSVISHAHDIMEGKSMNATFGKESKAQKRFDPSEAYVKHATRKGGRDVADVTSDPNKATKHMVENFGIRGVQWGNTVSDDERKHHAAKAVESLVDLADVVGLHPKDIALDGKLGLAFGARGKGTASAHYEPSTQVINLTRASGVGTLAHEWGHAFDHMLTDFKDDSASQAYMSASHRYTHEAKNKKTGFRMPVSEHSEMGDGYEKSELPMRGVRNSYKEWSKASEPYRKRLKSALRDAVRNGQMSQKKADDYWNSDHEIFARTFERHVQHKLHEDGRENTYLSGLGGDHPFWPTREEAAQMAPAFDAIFEEYRKHKHGLPEKVKFSRKAESVWLIDQIERYEAKYAGLSDSEISWLTEVEFYAGKNQFLFEFGEADHEPVAATSAKGSRSMAKVEAAEEIGDLKIVGISKDVHQCDRCGRSDLDKTIIVQVGDNPSDRYYFGSDCISKIMGGEPNKLMQRALIAEQGRMGKKESYSDDWLSIDRYTLYGVYNAYRDKTGSFANTSSTWDESKHPREAAGTSVGGQFRSAGGGASVTGQSSIASTKENPAESQASKMPQGAFQPTLMESEQTAEPKSSKKRDLVDRPDTQKHHSLHWKNQPAETQILLNDLKREFVGLQVIAANKIQMAGGSLTGDNVWENTDKAALQRVVDRVNKLNQDSIAKGGPRMDDLMNYNGVIPKTYAERFEGGKRFFDPEALRGKWFEEEPKQEELQEQSEEQPQEQSGNEQDAAPQSQAEENQEEPQFDEWGQSDITEDNRPAPITADDFKKAFRPKPPAGVSKAKMKQLEKAIRSQIRDDDEVVKAFVPLVTEAFKQIRDEVDAHNLALRQITGATAKDHSERDAKKGKGATVQSLAALTRKARAGELQPDEKKRFDEWVNDMNNQFPHILAGKGEMGLVDMIATGIKPQVDILDQEVAERAITLAGPEFFAAMEQPEEPTFEDDWQPDYEQTPFSWIGVGAAIEIKRYQYKVEKERYAMLSDAQIEAGNYKKKHLNLHGLRISIETKKGERRRPEWPPMPCDYGDIKGTEGNDGDPVDVFVGPNLNSEFVCVVDQVKEDGTFDEAKVLFGFDNEADAVACYKKAYTKDWKVGPVTCMTVQQFKAWLKDGNQRKQVHKQVSKYAGRFEPVLLSKYTWNEEDHPRGQPENAGQFVEKTYHHGTFADFDTFQFPDDQLGVHVGTATQATERLKTLRQQGSGGSEPKLLEVAVSVKNPLRMKDIGSWTPELVLRELARVKQIPKKKAEKLIADFDERLLGKAKSLVSGIHSFGDLHMLDDQQNAEYRKFVKEEYKSFNKLVKSLIADMGHDAILYKNDYEKRLDSEDSLIVLHPSSMRVTKKTAGTIDDRNEIRFNRT